MKGVTAGGNPLHPETSSGERAEPMVPYLHNLTPPQAIQSRFAARCHAEIVR